MWQTRLHKRFETHATCSLGKEERHIFNVSKGGMLVEGTETDNFSPEKTFTITVRSGEETMDFSVIVLRTQPRSMALRFIHLSDEQEKFLAEMK